MGRPGKLGVRNGIRNSPQMSFNNVNAQTIAKEIAECLKDNIASGAVNLMKKGDLFLKNILKRNDIDVNGFLDVIAHGNENSIQIINQGKIQIIDYKETAKLIKSKNKKIKGIRLLSCNTGSLEDGFAQKLANKLHVPVIAPTKYEWARSDGKHFVAGSRDGGITPDYSDIGYYKTFVPRRKK